LNKYFWIILFLASVITTAAVAVFLTLYFEPYQQAPLIVTPNNTAEASPTTSYYSDDRMKVRMYFLSSDQLLLEEEIREIPSSTVLKTKVELVLKAWLEGPQSPGLTLPVPAGTQLQSVFWSDPNKTMYVNFSETLIQSAPGHAMAEWATIYSIVNTVAKQSEVIEQVQILVNNQPVSDEYLVWDWSMPYKPNRAFEKK
jgi:hypothetical protein